MHRYRIRRSVALGSSLTVPLVCCLVVVAIIRPLTLGIAVGLGFAVAMTVANYTRVRRRSLTVSAEGLEVQRDTYGMFVPWPGVLRIQRRRHQWLFDVEELVVTDSRLLGRDSRGRPRALPEKLHQHPAGQRILLSLYDKEWRRGPIGEQLTRQGIFED